MKYLYINCLVFILMLGAISSNGQNVRLQRGGNFISGPGVSPTEVNQVLLTLERVLGEYSTAMTLYDKNQKRVTEASINTFEQMFTPNARIMKDFTSVISGENLSAEDYALEVYSRIKKRGVEVEMNSAELINLRKDGFGFLVAEVLVRKRIFSAVTQAGEIITIPAGNALEQKITFQILSDDMDRADISRIGPGVDQKPADDYTRLISISPSVGTSTWNSSMTNYWDQNHSDNVLETKGGLDYSIGVEFLTDRLITGPKQASRNLALSIGLRYSSFSINSNINNYNIENFQQLAQLNGVDIPSSEYFRMVRSVSVDEKVSINVLEIPLGLSYRLVNKQTSLIYLHARLIPGFTLGADSELEGVGFYDGILDNPNTSAFDESRFRIRRMQALGIDQYNSDDWKMYRVTDSDQLINQTGAPEVKGTTFALQLSPTAYFSFVDDNPAWGIMVGIDLTYHFGSYLDHSATTTDVLNSALKYNDDFDQGSFHRYYSDSMSGLSFAMRVGLFQRFNAAP